jgi:adenosine deaminase
MKTTLSVTFLDSQRMLEKYFYDGALEDKEMQNYLFIESHLKDPYKPDYIFKNAMEGFTKGLSIDQLLIATLGELSQMLVFRGECIYVKNELFERWQDSILSVSPLLVISFAIYLRSKESFLIDKKELIESIFKKSAIPSIHEPQLEHIFKERGLNEMHMHLTGTTEVDVVWQDALSRPKEFYCYIKKSISQKSVKEQYLQIGHFKQEDLYRLLKIASQIRDKMLSIIYKRVVKDPKQECAKELFTKAFFDIGRVQYYASTIHPLGSVESNCFKSSMHYESLFLMKSFEYMEGSSCTYFAQLFHYYLLIYSYFQKLLVQQKTQVGFDQFQKITLNELRELTEEKYTQRFFQLQGMYDDTLSVLEGRFSPKDSLHKSFKLLKSIRKGYDKEHKDKFQLKLVPHFIKAFDNRNPKKIITFRDLKLRLENKKKIEVLLDTLNFRDNDVAIYKELVVGFDAAANELHAKPEVFAPIFRKLAFLGYKNFTFHAGEDFVHLISGLRTVYEAVEFLEMQSGNRIGHATALGIDPELWSQRLYGSKLTLKQGEWLDDLVFVYLFCVENQELYWLLGKLELEIRTLFGRIYGSSIYYSMHHIVEAWKMRKHDPFIALRWREPSLFEDFETIELQKIKGFDKEVQDLYEDYHDGCKIEKYNKMIEIEPFKIFGVGELKTLQDKMIELLNKKNIAIETLPTSNVRISYYKNYDEHHLIRWLTQEPKPTVVVGSDDTGIFMTNLRNEYAHIYQMLQRKFHDDEKALSKIEHLNRNSKAFTFS